MRVFEIPKFNHPVFNFYLRRSGYIHVALVACTLISGKVAFDLQREEREKNLELIHASVRVDMVAMPTQTLNELKNLSSGVEEAQKEEKTEIVKEAEKVVTKEEPKEEPKVVDKTPDDTEAFQEAQAAKKRQNFLSKLKTIGNKKVESTGTQKADKGLYGEKESALKNLVLSGNKLSKGSAMYGDGSAAELTAYQAYKSRLPDFVRPHWKLPSFLADRNLKCRVRVWLNKNGDVTRTSIYQSSGEPEFDERAIEAVKAAAPFPAVSDSFGTGAMNGDIVLGFPL
ncbi:TonB family protein [Bacteriovorax sp. PP10]|uniref:TonB family protein n=1 Tax=Bacteriovorax antarcticus TaxID=3088717 RepID=A0ABU5VRA8_9BACT|nr:TonB family protein [Bacteriovorax sp. PP10]MEA9355578.1 TonB family protein [Bacteriovorax sp. PP10]